MASLIEYQNEWTIEELQKAYTAKRRIFNKRITRLSDSIGENQKISAYKKGGYRYQLTVTEIEKLPQRNRYTKTQQRRDWALRLAELDTLLGMRSLSLSGRAEIKRDTIRTLNEQGYVSINAGNYELFTAFMEWAKDNKVIIDIPSDKLVQAYDTYINGGQVEDETLQLILDEFFNAQIGASGADIFK